MSTNNEWNDSIAIRVDGLDGEEKIRAILTLEVIDCNGYSRSAVEGSSKCVIIALYVSSALESNLTLS